MLRSTDMLSCCVLPQCVFCAFNHGWWLFGHYLLHNPDHRLLKTLKGAMVRLQEFDTPYLLLLPHLPRLLELHQHYLHDRDREVVFGRQVRHSLQVG